MMIRLRLPFRSVPGRLLRRLLNGLPRGVILLPALLAIACTPDFDWREVRGSDAPYVVLMPAKPSTASRDIPLDGKPVPLTMTVARANDISFSVTTGKLPDPAQADRVLESMKQSLLHNTGATITKESAQAADGTQRIAIEGTFKMGQTPGEARLDAQFIARNGFVYQLVAYGPANALSGDVLDTFLTSFKPG